MKVSITKEIVGEIDLDTSLRVTLDFLYYLADLQEGDYIKDGKVFDKSYVLFGTHEEEVITKIRKATRLEIAIWNVLIEMKTVNGIDVTKPKEIIG